MSILVRFLSAAAIGLGVLVALVLSAMLLGGFAALGRTAAPDTGFLILEFIRIGVFVCVPLTLAAASWVLLRPESRSPAAWPETRSRLFLDA